MHCLQYLEFITNGTGYNKMTICSSPFCFYGPLGVVPSFLFHPSMMESAGSVPCTG